MCSCSNVFQYWFKLGLLLLLLLWLLDADDDNGMADVDNDLSNTVRAMV